MQAYCVRCQTMKDMKDSKAVTIKNGKRATVGICPKCGSRMFRLGKS